jgi:putative NADH-flavin reductase
MRIAVIGASGWLGGLIARRAIDRGHEVTVLARDRSRLEGIEGAAAVAEVDATDADALREAVAGHDVVIASVTDRSGADRGVIPATARALIAALPAAGVERLVFMGGGGSLEVEPGVRHVDEPGFPEAYRAEALAQAEALALLRSEGAPLAWSYLSPPPKDLVPGEGRGGHRVQGGDAPLVDAEGESRIEAGDLAAAAVDEAERPQFTGQRFTAAY